MSADHELMSFSYVGGDLDRIFGRRDFQRHLINYKNYDDFLILPELRDTVKEVREWLKKIGGYEERLTSNAHGYPRLAFVQGESEREILLRNRNECLREFKVVMRHAPATRDEKRYVATMARGRWVRDMTNNKRDI